MVGNIKALAEACKELEIHIDFLDENKNLARVDVQNHIYYFANASTPLNSDSVSRITEDKGFSYLILKGLIQMPKTVGFVDPFMTGRFTRYIKHTSYESIVNEMEEHFEYPFVIKPNSKQQGLNFAVVTNKEGAIGHLKVVFNQQSKGYDFVALTQEKIDIESEYRAFVVNNKVELIQRRTGEDKSMSQDLSKKIHGFVKPIFEVLNLRWGGVDIALDNGGKFWLLELNTRPGFTEASQEKIRLYKKVLELLKE